MTGMFKPSQIVYCQGRFRCRVVSDEGGSITYVALEGAEPSYKGTPLNAAKDLFTESPRKLQRDATIRDSEPCKAAAIRALSKE